MTFGRKWLHIGYLSLLRPSSAFYASFTSPHAITWRNAMWITYSGPQTGTGKHCSAGRVQLAQQQGLQAPRQSVLEVDLDKAR
eukprot:scaffold82314_cov36-Phaeocystis_antarctica.AAC.3